MLLIVCIVAAGCRGKHSRTVVQEESAPPAAAVPQGPMTSVKMNDAAGAGQLLSGFYGIEGNAWRWTAGHFALLMKTPPAAAQKGAVLTFALAIPDVIAQKLGAVKLSAAAGGKELKSETYSKAGSYTFTADIPPDALAKETVTIEFAMNKSLAPSPQDGRELGLIASSASLDTK